MKFLEFNKDDYTIHNREKLDRILVELCQHLIKGQQNDPVKYGMVAACVLDPKNRKVLSINEAAEDGTRKHAERVAIEAYNKKYGDIPTGSIILTTLSPCNEDDTEMAAGRFGESCTDLINDSNVRKVYCGYMDPSQQDAHNEYTLEATSNNDIQGLCKQFADTFLDTLDEGIFSKPLKKKSGPSPEEMRKYFEKEKSKEPPKYDTNTQQQPQQVFTRNNENFADGKNPGRKGLAKRSGVNTKASVSSLRKTAKHSTGEKQRMAHWLANMKAGRAKKK